MLIVSASKIFKVHSISKTGNLVDESWVVQNVDPGSTIKGVAFNHTGDTVFTCTSSSVTINTLVHDKNVEQRKLPIPSDYFKKITCMGVSRDSRVLCIGLIDGTLRLWDLRNKCFLKKIQVHTNRTSIACLEFSPDNSAISVGCNNGEIVVFNLRMNKCQAILRIPDTGTSETPKQMTINSIRFNNFKKNVIACCTDFGGVFVWDIFTLSLKCSFQALHATAVSDLSFSTVNKSLLVSVGLDKKISFVDTEKGTVVRELKAKYPISSVSFSPAGDMLIMGTVDGLLVLYSLHRISRYSKAPPLDVLSCHDLQPIQHVSFLLPPKNQVSQRNKKPTEEAKSHSQEKFKSKAISRVTREIEALNSSNLFSPPAEKKERVPKKSFESAPLQTSARTSEIEEPSQTEEKLEIDSESNKAQTFNINESLSSIHKEKTIEFDKNYNYSRKDKEQEKMEVVQMDPERIEALENNFLRAIKSWEDNILREMDKKINSISKDIVFEIEQAHYSTTQNIQLELMRQFKLQLDDLTSMLNKTNMKIEELAKENELLREKNRMLSRISEG